MIAFFNLINMLNFFLFYNRIWLLRPDFQIRRLAKKDFSFRHVKLGNQETL